MMGSGQGGDRGGARGGERGSALDAPSVPTVMKCDFCQREVPSVRRVALDGEYERLQTPHAVQYSCPDCFEKKDRQRRGA